MSNRNFAENAWFVLSSPFRAAICVMLFTITFFVLMLSKKSWYLFVDSLCKIYTDSRNKNDKGN